MTIFNPLTSESLETVSPSKMLEISTILLNRERNSEIRTNWRPIIGALRQLLELDARIGLLNQFYRREIIQARPSPRFHERLSIDVQSRCDRKSVFHDRDQAETGSSRESRGGSDDRVPP